MSNNIELHQIVMKQAQIIAQLTDQLAASVGVVSTTAEVTGASYDPNLRGSDLVREHFRRGGGELLCHVDDTSDANSVADAFIRSVSTYSYDRGHFISGYGWKYAVACDDVGNVLTADQLLGGL